MKKIKLKIIHRIKKIFLPQAIFWGIINLVLTRNVFALRAETVPDKLESPLQAKSFGELVEAIADLAAQIGIPIAAIFIIYSGLMFVTARGSEDKLKKAKDTFMWTIVGTFILLGAWVIARTISGTVRGLK